MASATPEQAARISRLLDQLMAEAREGAYQAGRADALAQRRPQRAPLTNRQAVRVYENSPLINDSMTFAAFERVLRVVEGVHQIEPPSHDR